LSVTRPLLVLALALTLAAPPLRAAEADPDAGAYLAARSAVMAGDYRDAVGWFTRALIADPTNPALLDGALVGQISLGEFDAAYALADQVKRLGQRSQSSAVALTAHEIATGQFEGYLTALKEGRSVNPAVDALTAAWAELGAGRMSEALAGFDKIAATDGLQPFGLYHKALALASVGDFEGADEILSGGLQVMRQGQIAHAQILSQLERNDEAIALLEKTFGTDQDPMIDGLIARLKAGETLPFDVARNATDGVAEVYFTVATAMNGEATDATTLIYSRVASYLRPDHLDAILLTGALLQQQEQFAVAMEAYGAVPQDHPSYYAAVIGRAESMAAMGQTDEAIALLTELSKTHGDLMIVHLSLGDMLRREERFAEAAAAYDRAIDVLGTPDQRHWVLFYSRGIANEREKQYEKSDADFRRALELNPDQPQVLNYLGYSMVERNINLDEALGMIQRAVALQPDSGYIIDSLAWALFMMGRYEEALEPMEKASVLEPVDPIVTDHLGDVYWAVGRKREAEFQWHRALSFDPEEDQAIRIRRKLEVGLDAVLAEEGATPLAQRLAVAEQAGATPQGN